MDMVQKKQLLSTRIFLKKYNINILWQVPRSPYTNVLDLGYWSALQSAVEREHFGKCGTTHSLMRSVMRAWQTSDDSNVLSKIFDRLETVLLNILDGDGKNDLVECSRGRSLEKKNWRT